MHDASASFWRVKLFGPLKVTSPSAEQFHLGTRKHAELIAFLALRRNAIVHRDAAVEALWPDVDQEAGRNRLKQTLAVLRKEVQGFPIAVHGKHEIEMPRDQVVVDYHVVEGRLKWFKGMPEPYRSEAAKQVMDLAHEEFLPGLNAPWILSERRRYSMLWTELDKEQREAHEVSDPRFRFGDDSRRQGVGFVGREREVASLRSWLSIGGRRAMYVVGPPGVGKTRLLEEALESTRDLCDAVVFLSTVQGSETPFRERIGQALGLQDPGMIDRSVVQLLRGFRRPVLALDDFDQSSKRMQKWVAELMGSVPGLYLLAAGRSRLEDSRYEVLEVEPLEESESNYLMKRLAARAGMSDAAIEDHEVALSKAAEHLDGLPLALEVAAGWLEYLQPERLLERLRSTPEVLLRQPSGTHDSLLACIRALQERLSPSDLRALRLLCECRGGCGSELAQSVIGDQWPTEVRSLVARSMATRTMGQCGPRFFVLQAIRDAVKALEDEPVRKESSRLYTRGCLTVASRACFEVNEGDRATWLNWMRDESANVLAACRTAGSDPEFLDEALILMDVLTHPMWVIGRAQDWREVRSELQEASEGQDLSLRAQVVLRCAEIRDAHAVGNEAEAARMARGFLDAVRERPEGDLLWARAHWMVAECLKETEPLIAAEHYRTSSDWFIKAGYHRHTIWNHAELVRVARRLGRHDEAEQLRREAVEMAERFGDRNSVAMYRMEFAGERLREGRFEEAAELARQAAEIFEELAESLTQANALVLLAAAQIALNQPLEAEAKIAKASALCPTAYQALQAKISHLSDRLQDGPGALDLALLTG